MSSECLGIVTPDGSIALPRLLAVPAGREVFHDPGSGIGMVIDRVTERSGISHRSQRTGADRLYECPLDVIAHRARDKCPKEALAEIAELGSRRMSPKRSGDVVDGT